MHLAPNLAQNRYPLAVVMVLLAVALTAAIVPDFLPDVGPLAMMVGHGTAAVLFYKRRSGSGVDDADAWRFFSMALAAGAIGVVVVGSLTTAGVVLPAFGPVDIIFLGGYLALVAGLVQMARGGEDGDSWKVTIIDTAVGAVALSTLVWIAFGHRMLQNLVEADTWSRTIAPLYPVVDIAVVVGVMAMVLRRSSRRLDPKLIVFSIGLLAQVFADLSYLAEGVGKTFADATPRFDLFVFSSACYVTVGILLSSEPHPKEFPDRATSPWWLMWPYLLCAGLIGLHVYHITTLPVTADQVITLIGSLLVGLLVVARQVYAIRQNHVRIEYQRRELVASVSHELRTPLTGVLGYLEILAAEDGIFANEQRLEMIKVAAGQADQLSRVVTDMVAMARDENRAMPLRKSTTNVLEICHLAMDRAGESDCELRVDPSTVIEFEADRDRLSQGLSNLLVNARRYGRKHIQLVAFRGTDQIVFEIHDDGPGVPVRHRERIWEQFERGAHRYDATIPGVGVGLTIAKAIALAHGGTATYRRSTSVGGACFSLSVPIAARSISLDPAGELVTR